jgi:hypothetical protein
MIIKSFESWYEILGYALAVKTLRRPAFTGLCLALAILSNPASPASAHHATATEYDISKTVTLTGKILRVDWANPHVHVYIEVKPQRGVAQQWDVEFPSPGGTIVSGLSKDALGADVTVMFQAYSAKPGFRPSPRKNSSLQPPSPSPTHFACATGITLSDTHHYTFVVGI